jgi:predicted dienelactone hydrolase
MAKRRIIQCAAVLLVFSALFSASRGHKILKAFAPDGPYKVGVMISHLDLQGRKAPVMIWYPAKVASSAEPYEYTDNFEGSAVLNAELDHNSAPYPLLMFSHGMGACGDQSVFYTENLASFGYIAIAPDHKDSAMCHIEGKPDISFGKMVLAALKGHGDLGKTVRTLFADRFKENGFGPFYRPAEASATIDYALALNKDPGSTFYKTMDPEKIGATGHSFGGFTTLALGGLPFHCEGFDPNSSECQSTDKYEKIHKNPCCQLKEKKDPMFMRDLRVKAMLPLGAAAMFPQLDRAAKEIKIPIMMIDGDSKKMEVPWDPIWTIFQNAPPPKYVVRLKQTDHMTISDMTLAANPALVKLFLAGFRSGYPEKAQAYKDYSVAFFNKYLKGDESKSKVLTGPVNKYVEIWYKEP